MSEAIGMSPGKVILLGEHAVVYGYPALAHPIDLFSKIIISDNSEGQVSLHAREYQINLAGKNIQELFSNTPRELNSIQKGLELWEKFNNPLSNISVFIQSEIWSGSGLGSSASVAVALYSALCKKYNKIYKISDAINFSFQMERVAHGQPSGVDNTVCSVNAPIYFKQQKFQKLNVCFDFCLLLIDTGTPHNTQKAVNQIAILKEKSPDEISKIFREIGKLAENGRHVLEYGDLQQFQTLMEKNQNFLTQLGLMTDSMERIYNLGLNKQIRGLKLSGAGQGGCLIALDDPLKLSEFQNELTKNKIRNHLVHIHQNPIRRA